MELRDHVMSTEYGEKLQEKGYYYIYKFKVHGIEYATTAKYEIEQLIFDPVKQRIVSVVEKYTSNVLTDEYKIRFENAGFIVIDVIPSDVGYYTNNPQVESYLLSEGTYKRYK